MDDTCVCCGRIVPEGMQVCPLCETKVNGKGWGNANDICVVANSGDDGRGLHWDRDGRDMFGREFPRQKREVNKNEQH